MVRRGSALASLAREVSAVQLNSMSTTRNFLRHTVATLAYRGGKAIRGAPVSFSGHRAGASSRTAGEILAHVDDLLDWALHLAKGQDVYVARPPVSWDDDVRRFRDALAALDTYLASDAPLSFTAEQIFQGPIADALTHVGQIALLRRLADSPVKGENYFKANIEMGVVGSEQARPVREFD
jgi:hypothetical protein